MPGLNPLGLVHGGLYSAMLDVALAMSGSFKPAPDDLLPGLTLSLNLQYLAPLKLEDGFAWLRLAVPAVVSRYFCRRYGEGPDGRLIANATGVSNLTQINQLERLEISVQYTPYR